MLGNTRDQQTVDAKGRKVTDYIAGVRVRSAVTHLDERGELCEVLQSGVGLQHRPSRLRLLGFRAPGKVKGWVYHKEQDDRLFASFGTNRIVLYDMRE